MPRSPNSPSASHPPSRHSTRAITPVRADTNFVRPNNDSRKSLPSTSIVPDSTQNVVQNSSQVSKKRKRRDDGLDVDDVDDYFHKPRFAEGQTSGEPMVYECRWCGNSYKKATGSRGNLYKHRDGDLHRTPCPSRNEAIAQGAKLPLTPKEIAQRKQEKGKGVEEPERKSQGKGEGTSEIEKKTQEKGKGATKKLFQTKLVQTKLVQTKTVRSKPAPSGSFDLQILNQMLLMWLVRASLPWSRMDEYLECAFNYTRPGVKFFSQVWAATQVHMLYRNLQVKAIAPLKKLKSKFTLINDVWATKGKPRAFLGISAAYVTDDWVFKTIHLGLKYIPWTRNGKSIAIPFGNIITQSDLHTKILAQTTQPGSNHVTMTEEVDQLVLSKTGTQLNLSRNHIRCFVHNIELILSAGFKAVPLADAGLIKSKKEPLGFVAILDPFVEESEITEESGTFDDDDDDVGFDDDDTDDENDSDIDGTETQVRNNPIDAVLKKVDYVIRRITDSKAKRIDFATWSKNLGYSGPRLIAGYLSRWDILFQSRDRAYNARNVINKLIENEKERHSTEGGTKYYKDYEITSTDWEVVKKLNDVLGEFYYIAKKMEGDIPSASMMLAEYWGIKNYFAKKIDASPDDTDFNKMFAKMSEKTYEYLGEAMACDTVILATILNPSYRLSIFQMWFPSNYAYAQSLIQAQFNQRKIEYEANLRFKEPGPSRVDDQPLRRQGSLEEVDFFPDTNGMESEDELSIYLRGKYKLPASQAHNSLQWWKDHEDDFPILSLLARDYLACCSTATSLERCFSAAADTCAGDRENVVAHTIERWVNCNQWLHAGLIPDGEFQAVQNIIAESIIAQNS